MIIFIYEKVLVIIFECLWERGGVHIITPIVIVVIFKWFIYFSALTMNISSRRVLTTAWRQAGQWASFLVVLWILIWIRIRWICMSLCLPDPHPNPLVPSTDLNPDPSIIKQKQYEKPKFLLFCDFFYDFLPVFRIRRYVFGPPGSASRSVRQRLQIRGSGSASGSVPKCRIHNTAFSFFSRLFTYSLVIQQSRWKLCSGRRSFCHLIGRENICFRRICLCT